MVDGARYETSRDDSIISSLYDDLNANVHRDQFVYVLSQWEMTLQCNVVSHWLGAYTKWSLCICIGLLAKGEIVLFPYTSSNFQMFNDACVNGVRKFRKPNLGPPELTSIGIPIIKVNLISMMPTPIPGNMVFILKKGPWTCSHLKKMYANIYKYGIIVFFPETKDTKTKYKTAVLLTHWSYCSLALRHQYHHWSIWLILSSHNQCSCSCTRNDIHKNKCDGTWAL